MVSECKRRDIVDDEGAGREIVYKMGKERLSQDIGFGNRSSALSIIHSMERALPAISANSALASPERMRVAERKADR